MLSKLEIKSGKQPAFCVKWESSNIVRHAKSCMLCQHFGLKSSFFRAVTLPSISYNLQYRLQSPLLWFRTGDHRLGLFPESQHLLPIMLNLIPHTLNLTRGVSNRKDAIRYLKTVVYLGWVHFELYNDSYIGSNYSTVPCYLGQSDFPISPKYLKTSIVANPMYYN